MDEFVMFDSLDSVVKITKNAAEDEMYSKEKLEDTDRFVILIGELDTLIISEFTANIKERLDNRTREIAAAIHS